MRSILEFKGIVSFYYKFQVILGFRYPTYRKQHIYTAECISCLLEYLRKEPVAATASSPASSACEGTV